MRKLANIWLLAVAVCLLALAQQGGTSLKGKPAAPDWKAKRAAHLLDRGSEPQVKADRGGGPPTPLLIAYPGGGPLTPAAPPPVGAFPGTGLGGYFGNLFPPGPPGYPTGFLTGGTATGFLITGAYAWQWPVTAGGMPGGSTLRSLAAAAAGVPSTPFAPVPIAGFTVFTVSTMAPGPTGIVGGPAVFFTPLPVGAAAPACFCGMLFGGPGFITGWGGNGLGASVPPVTGIPPLRVGFFPPFFTPAPILSAVPATPANYIAGCFAAGATTPVELQSFSIE